MKHEHIKIYNKIPFNSGLSKLDALTPCLDTTNPIEALECLFNPEKRRNDNCAINTVQRIVQIPSGHISDKFDDEPYIVPFIVEGSDKAIIIVPGGAYYDVSLDNEGYPSCEYFNKKGISCFVLKYRVYPYLYPTAMLDLRRAICYVKYHAKEYGIDKNKISVIGYSAGGNLVATTLLQFLEIPESVEYEKDEIDNEGCNVSAIGLIYPELLADRNLLSYQFGEKIHTDESYYEKISKQQCLPNFVTKNTPPIFLTNCIDDNVVNPINAHEMAKACLKNNVKFELHMFVEGGHGFGVRQDDIPPMYGNKAFNMSGTNMWPDLYIKWFEKVLKYEV